MRPPTGYNVTAWTFLLNEAEQRKTVNQMHVAARPCAVYSPAGLADWTSGTAAAAGRGDQPVAGRPLVDYIMGLKPVVSYGGYEFRVPQELVSTWRFDYLLSGSRSFTGTGFLPFQRRQRPPRLCGCGSRAKATGGRSLEFNRQRVRRRHPAAGVR